MGLYKCSVKNLVQVYRMGNSPVGIKYLGRGRIFFDRMVVGFESYDNGYKKPNLIIDNQELRCYSEIIEIDCE